MKYLVFLLTILFLSFFSLTANDTITHCRPSFFSITYADGFVLPNDHIFKGDAYYSPHVFSLSLKYAWGRRADGLTDKLYGMPYNGIGLFLPRIEHHGYMGTPFSVFFFQGARLRQFNSTVSLHYEINLGLSMNWKHYNRVTKPDLVSIGSSVNAHLAGNIYLKWRLSPQWDMNAGLNLVHFSNGAQRVPNYGMNMLSGYVEMVCYLHRREEKKACGEKALVLPKLKKTAAHDLTVMITRRTIKIDTVGTGMKTKYPRKHFLVAGASYAYLFDLNRRIKLGPSLEAVYDESANALFRGEYNCRTGEYVEYVKAGKDIDRFSVGLSLKGELSMPGYSIFANAGYDILHKDKRDMKLYFIYGAKLYLTRKLYVALAVRTTNLTRSRYIYLGIGYRFR